MRNRIDAKPIENCGAEADRAGALSPDLPFEGSVCLLFEVRLCGVRGHVDVGRIEGLQELNCIKDLLERTPAFWGDDLERNQWFVCVFIVFCNKHGVGVASGLGFGARSGLESGSGLGARLGSNPEVHYVVLLHGLRLCMSLDCV